MKGSRRQGCVHSDGCDRWQAAGNRSGEKLTGTEIVLLLLAVTPVSLLFGSMHRGGCVGVLGPRVVVQDVSASLGLDVAAAAIRFDFLTCEYAVFLSLDPITRALEPGYYFVFLLPGVDYVTHEFVGDSFPAATVYDTVCKWCAFQECGRFFMYQHFLVE